MASSSRRQAFDSPQNLLLRPHRLLEIRDLGLRNAYLETEEVVGLHEARLHVAERLKASDHETRAHEEDEGESNLRNDERTTRPMSFSTVARRTSAFLERRHHVRSRIFEDGNETEEDPGEEREPYSEHEHGRPTVPKMTPTS